MSRSFHVTSKIFKGITKPEVIEQLKDPYSEVNQFREKSYTKQQIIKNRKLKNRLLLLNK